MTSIRFHAELDAELDADPCTGCEVTASRLLQAAGADVDVDVDVDVDRDVEQVLLPKWLAQRGLT